MESGHNSGSGFFIHGTVVTNTDPWFFILIFMFLITIHGSVSAIELS